MKNFIASSPCLQRDTNRVEKTQFSLADFSLYINNKLIIKVDWFKGMRKVSQKVVPLNIGFTAILCNYLCDVGYFL